MNKSNSLNNLKVINEFIQEVCRIQFRGLVRVQIALNEKDESKIAFNLSECRKVDNVIIHSMIVSPILLKNKPDVFCKDLLTRLVDLYAYDNGIQTCSRKHSYHNLKFKETCAKFEIDAEYSNSQYGYTVSKIPKIILDMLGKLEVNSIYNYEVRHSDNSSTVKYIDKHGNSVRATKRHILFCLDNYPDLADEIEKRYGIARMCIESK